MFMFHKNPNPSATVANLETTANEEQCAMMAHGIESLDGKKMLDRNILERPENPYKSRATEALAMALEKAPIQNNEVAGVKVDLKEVLACWQFLTFEIPQEDIFDIHLYIASDATFLLSYKMASMSEHLMATLPLKISSKTMTHADTGAKFKIKPYIKRSDVREPGLTVQANGTTEVIDPTANGQSMSHIANAALHDLKLEAMGLALAYFSGVPPYKIDEPGHDAKMYFLLDEGWSQSLDASYMQWLNRDTLSFCDVHLPFTNINPETQPLIEQLLEDVTRLCLLRLNIDNSDLNTSVVLQANDPLEAPWGLIQCLDDRAALMFGYNRLETEEKRKLCSEISEQLKKLELFGGAFGYRYLFKRGVVSAYLPMTLACVQLDKIETEGLSEKKAEWRIQKSARSIQETENGIFKEAA